VKDFLTKKLKEALGPKYDAATFTPPYNPWEQRLCLVPDCDLFSAMKAGKADIVTDHIERIDAQGIRLKSGKRLDCDVIVTATGLALAMAGKIALGMDGEPVRMNERWYYKGCMYSNLPNLAQVFGYLNASWTLRADIDADYVCRLLNHMKKVGADSATPVLTDESTLTPDTPLDLSSGYIQRGLAIQPKNAKDMPWRLNQDYVWDRKYMKENPLDDGIMHFGKATGALAEAAGEVVEPAE